MLNEASQMNQRVVLVGLESVGKTSLFSFLTEQRIGEEVNAKGSTIFLKERMFDSFTIVDTPGLRMDDSETYQAVKEELNRADHALITIKGTHFQEEFEFLWPLLSKGSFSSTLLVTFVDRMTESTRNKLKNYVITHKLNVVFLSPTEKTKQRRQQIITSIKEGKSLTLDARNKLASIHIDPTHPKKNWYENRILGAPLAIMSIFLMFGLPIFLAYHFSSVTEDLIKQMVINPVVTLSIKWPEILRILFTGDYGLFTLGLYSFIWAFPVVLFISIASAITDDAGIKDQIIDTLDPWMKKIGLHGQDLVPILTGFGCNVVAVHQTRGCSLKTRKQCVSLLSFGSACSYQIGATLSIFQVAQLQWLFIPYLLSLFIVGVLHNRIWFPIKDIKWVRYFKTQRTFIQKPSYQGVFFRVKSVISQFLTQAMPIFLVICIIAALLDYTHILTYLTGMATPVMTMIGAPPEASAGLIFSMIRKDGILLFNEGNGALLNMMSAGTIFVLVYLASTLSACLVTLWTIVKELKGRIALSLFVKQFITSIVSAMVILLILNLVGALHLKVF